MIINVQIHQLNDRRINMATAMNQTRSVGLVWGVLSHRHNWELLTIWLDAFAERRSVTPPKGIRLFKVSKGREGLSFPMILSDSKTMRWCFHPSFSSGADRYEKIYGVPSWFCNAPRKMRNRLMCPHRYIERVYEHRRTSDICKELTVEMVCRSQITRLVRSMDELGWDPSREVTIR